jgi:hypothetical protein
MRYAAVLVGSIALLLSVADAVSQEPMAEARVPLAAATRDAQHLAECIKALDAGCASSLYDVRSYELLNRLQNGRFSAESNAKDLARYFDTLRRRGVRYMDFETSPPQELLADGVRLYAFVPYHKVIEFPDDKRMSAIRSFLVALSADQGKTWTFVDGEGFTAEQIRYIVPSYADQPLPDTVWSDGVME